MAKETDFSGLLKRISKETGKSEGEAKKLIKEKKAKFSGLLTDGGAAFMVAKELGLEVDTEKHAAKSTKINCLEEGMKNLELPVRVLHIYSPRSYKKDEKEGQYIRLLVGDETGEMTLTLWREHVKMIEKEKVERGSVLLLKNAYVSGYKGQKQLGISFNGSLEIKPDIDSSTLPKAGSIALKIADLGEGMENVDVFARVIRVFEVNEFEREGEKRKVLNFLVGDGSGQARATAWNNLAEAANRLEPGMLVKIEGAYTKKGLKGLELQLGWNSRIIQEPTIGFTVPELGELSEREFNRLRISELKEGALAEVFGTVTALSRGNLLFRVCPKCGSKLVQEEKGFVCGKCGEIKEPKGRLVVSATIDDGSGALRASFFGRNAERLLGKSTAEIEKELQELTPAEEIEALARDVVGKDLEVSGTVKKNSLSPGKLELSASIVKSADAVKETEELLGRVKGK